MRFEMHPRNERVGELIEACARKQISFEECCKEIAAMGFKTTSVYEMIRAKEWELDNVR